MNSRARRWIESRYTDILPVGTLRARLTKGTFWILLGAVISQGLALLASVVVARLLGQVGFGELGIIKSTVGMLGVFAGLGLGITATKYVATLRTKDVKRTGRILGLSIVATTLSGGVVSLLLFASAPLLTSNLLNAPHLTNALRLGSGVMFFGALQGTQLGALAGLEAFRTLGWVTLIRGLLNFPAMIIGVWWFGLIGGVGAMVLVAAGGWWINQLALRHECRRNGITITYHDIRNETGVLWQFSVPAFLAAAIVGPVMWIANTMLVNQPYGYAEMGIFNAVIQWRTVLVFLPELIIIQVMLPILSNLYGEQHFEQYKKALRIDLGAMALVSLVMAIPMILASQLIMSAYGPGFAQGANVLAIMALSTVISSTIGVIGAAISSMGKMWHGFGLNCIWALALIIAAQVLIPAGAYGLALAYLISYIVHLMSSSGYILILLRGPTLRQTLHSQKN